ncbi:hypothetical protein DQW50_08600 [Halorubrum sp. 48-1-W]|uniref:hypothetical protein n=1 Tax=Halorubrum sp. 48-1-W TaxID=2249761 RepID=UPI000DCE8F61|nr:hypothetical protein [Halorubrum sp. 48-1-W]RAW45594.1 hypothetical protein DQW50_08600 [Halorubrum sp. 48-1-W]
MSDGETDADEIRFLSDRYQQLTENQMENNQIIHTTFYISVVFFGAMVGVIPEIETRLSRVGLYAFSSGVFVSLLLWTRTYLNNRRVNEEKINEILTEMNREDRTLGGITSPEKYFPDPGDQRQDFWTKRKGRFGYKEIMLQSYYVGLALIAVLVGLVDLLIVG